MTKFKEFIDKNNTKIYINVDHVSKMTDSDRLQDFTCVYLGGSQVGVNVKGGLEQVIAKLEGREESTVVNEVVNNKINNTRKNRKSNAQKKDLQ